MLHHFSLIFSSRLTTIPAAAITSVVGEVMLSVHTHVLFTMMSGKEEASCGCHSLGTSPSVLPHKMKFRLLLRTYRSTSFPSHTLNRNPTATHIPNMSVFNNLRNLFSHMPATHATDPELHHPRNEPELRQGDLNHPLASRTTKYFKARSKRLMAKRQRIEATEMKESEPVQQVATPTIYQRYVPIRLLGSGGNGEVYLSHDSTTGIVVAVKTVYHGKSRSPPNEAQILRLLGQHVNVVQFQTVLKHPHREGCMQLVFECCESDLGDYINTYSGNIPELFNWSVFKQVTNGLHYIHSKQIVHEDLKPANILLARAQDGELYPTLKIADFGSASVDPPSDVPRGHMGTLGLQPPEVTYRSGPENDVWSLGCIIYELAARMLPLNNFEKANMDADTWFDLSGKAIPLGTRHRASYKRFCHFMAFYPASPRRIDSGPLCPGSTVVSSKLLNYMMMRALDINYRTRITTEGLQKYLPVLDSLVYTVMASGREAILNEFEDGRDNHWRQISIVTDSSVFAQLFYVLVLCARQSGKSDMMGWGVPLLGIMEVVELRAARTFMEELRDTC
jgi:serine/threonine protein kinase